MDSRNVSTNICIDSSSVHITQVLDGVLMLETALTDDEFGFAHLNQ